MFLLLCQVFPAVALVLKSTGTVTDLGPAVGGDGALSACIYMYTSKVTK